MIGYLMSHRFREEDSATEARLRRRLEDDSDSCKYIIQILCVWRVCWLLHLSFFITEFYLFFFIIHAFILSSLTIVFGVNQFYSQLIIAGW